MGADPPAERPSSANKRPPRSPAGHLYPPPAAGRSNSSLGSTSVNSRTMSRTFSRTMSSSVASGSSSGIASKGSSSSARQLAALKQSRKQARRRQLLKGHSRRKGSSRGGSRESSGGGGTTGSVNDSTLDSNDSEDNSTYKDEEDNSIMQGRDMMYIPPSPPPPVRTVIGRAHRDQEDEKTYVTYGTYGTLTTMGSAPYSVFSSQHSIFDLRGFCDAHSWEIDLGMFNPFILDPDGLHERIRRQMAYSGASNNGRGSRLTQLLAAQKAFPGSDIDAAIVAQHVPRSFYRTVMALRENFRSEAVEETSIVGDHSLMNKFLRDHMPSKDDLVRYASEAKKNLLDLISSLEAGRKRCGKTLGPVIERLRVETEKSCIQSSTWCSENYSRLVATSIELQKQLSDDNEEDWQAQVSDLDGDEYKPISAQRERVILGKLQYAATSFLESYADLLFALMPSSCTPCNPSEKEKPATMEASTSIKFGRDRKRTTSRKPKPLAEENQRQTEQLNASPRGVLGSQDTGDFEATEEFDDTYELTEEITEDQIASEDPLEVVIKDANVASKPASIEQRVDNQQVKVGLRDPPMNVAGGVDPDGKDAKHADDASVESSQCRRKRKSQSSRVSSIKQQVSREEKRAARKSVSSQDIPGNLEKQAAEYPIESFQSDSSAVDVAEWSMGQQKVKVGRETFDHDTDINPGAEGLQGANRSVPGSQSMSTAKLEKASTSVWRKLEKLNRKKKKFAVTMFGEVINEIEREDIDVASTNSHLDDLSLMTNGTQDNPIVLLDDDEEEDVPREDRPANRRRESFPEYEHPRLCSKDLERLSRLEDQSQVSALTFPTALASTTNYLQRNEMKDESHSPGESYGSQEEEAYTVHRKRLEAAENLLSSFKTHMNERRSNNATVVDDSYQTFHEHGYEENPRMPNLGYNGLVNNPQGGRYSNVRQQDDAVYVEPEIIQVIDAEEFIENPKMFPQSRPLADTDGHRSNSEPDQVSAPRHKPKLLADPNRHAMIDVNWKPSIQADAPASNRSLGSPRIEERDDHQRQSTNDVYKEKDGKREISKSYSRSDPPHGRRSGSRPPVPEVFRERRPSSFSSLPGESDSRSVTSHERRPSSFSSLPCESDSRSVTSSILGKRIPGRSKTVSWNLPEEDKSYATTGSSSRRSSSKRSGASLSHDESILRAAAARRELAKLSQKQAQRSARAALTTSSQYH